MITSGPFVREVVYIFFGKDVRGTRVKGLDKDIKEMYLSAFHEETAAIISGEGNEYFYPGSLDHVRMSIEQ
jgi:hypothetical protein